MDEEPINPKEMTSAQAAKYLGVSRTRISELSNARRIGRRVAGKYWVYTKAELDAYREQALTNKGGRPKSYALIPTPVIRVAT
jgi:hypothetical protein